MSDLVPGARPPMAITTARAERRLAASGCDDGEPALEQVDIKELLATLRRRWLVLVTITVASVGTAWYMAKSQAPRYQAVATIRLQDTHRQVTGGVDDPRGQQFGGGAYGPTRSSRSSRCSTAARSRRRWWSSTRSACA